jgi:hypothetical protein
MADEYDVNVEIPIDVLVGKLLSNRAFVNGVAEAVRNSMLNNSRAWGDVLGGYAGTKSPAFQNLVSQAAQGRWQNVGGKQTWVKG